MEMQARQDEGIAFMEGRRAHWAQDDNGFAFHNWWHVALFNLDNDRFDRVLEIYDGALRPEPSEIQLEMLDAAALLWRLRLRGIDIGGRYEELAATYEAVAEHGFYAFNDMHAMMAYVATGRDKGRRRAGASSGGDRGGVGHQRPHDSRGGGCPSCAASAPSAPSAAARRWTC